MTIADPDYVLLHANLLACAASVFMLACNDLDEARERHEEAEPGEEAAAAYDVMYAAQERRSEAWQVLRNAVHEFEKRRDRAIAASGVPRQADTLLRKPGPLPPGCYCKPGRCAAPVVMGQQTPCRDPAKAAMPRDASTEERT